MAQLQRLTSSLIPAEDTEEQRKFSRLILRCHMLFLFFLTFHAVPSNSVSETLEGWRTPIRAKVAAENMFPPYPQDGGRSLCSAQVHCVTNQEHHARIRAQQQQAEKAERGQHLQKQLSSAASFLDIRTKEGGSTNADDVEYFLRSMANSAWGEGDEYQSRY